MIGKCNIDSKKLKASVHRLSNVTHERKISQAAGKATEASINDNDDNDTDDTNNINDGETHNLLLIFEIKCIIYIFFTHF